MSLDFSLLEMREVEIFETSITHNHISRAYEIVPLLEKGLKLLKSDPEKFKQFNAPNGWGKYEQFVPFVEVEASR